MNYDDYIAELSAERRARENEERMKEFELSNYRAKMDFWWNRGGPSAAMDEVDREVARTYYKCW